jgi:hypothetical protein
MISNSSVLANAYRIVDEKLERCLPCETKVDVAGTRKKPVKPPAAKKKAAGKAK